MLSALWVQVLSAGACHALLPWFVQLGAVSWGWSWPWPAVAVLLVLRGGRAAAVVPPLLLLWSGVAVFTVDLEVALCGHRVAL